jgi:hypothetical protein
MQSALFSSIVEIPSFLRINKCIIAHFIAYDATKIDRLTIGVQPENRTAVYFAFNNNHLV